MSFPKALKIPGLVWQGALTIENAKKIIDSPSRKQVVENIRKGDAAVWLFLESGNTERDSHCRRFSKPVMIMDTRTLSVSLLSLEIVPIGS